MNRTLDGLLDLCLDAREVAILGPSTPLLPQDFAARGVSLLSGVQVVNPERALRIVSEGVNSMRSPERSIVIVTHYERLLEYVQPDQYHVMLDGRIGRS